MFFVPQNKTWKDKKLFFQLIYYFIKTTMRRKGIKEKKNPFFSIFLMMRKCSRYNLNIQKKSVQPKPKQLPNWKTKNNN